MVYKSAEDSGIAAKATDYYSCSQRLTLHEGPQSLKIIKNPY